MPIRLTAKPAVGRTPGNSTRDSREQIATTAQSETGAAPDPNYFLRKLQHPGNLVRFRGDAIRPVVGR